MKDNLIPDIKKYVNMLLGPLEDHYYHQYEHALDVMNRSIELGQKEGLSKDNLELLLIAALFHDTGFIIQYDDNEFIWASIAKNYLKWILYPDVKIKIIENIIIATNPKVEAITLLERIMKDSDTDNLGRPDFFEKWERLRQELELIKKIKILDPDWTHFSINFLREHKFYTNTEIKERQPTKEQNLKVLEDMASKNV